MKRIKTLTAALCCLVSVFVLTGCGRGNDTLGEMEGRRSVFPAFLLPLPLLLGGEGAPGGAGRSTDRHWGRLKGEKAPPEGA